MITGLHTLICEVSEMNTSIRFYRDLLGFQVEFESPHWSSLRIGNTRVGLHPPFDRSGGARGGGWIFGLQTDDLVGLRKQLESENVVCGEFHATPSGVIFDFCDPDGNRLQVIQPGLQLPIV